MIPGWDLLRHGGLLLDPPRLREVGQHTPPALDGFTTRELRRRLTSLLDDGADRSALVAFFLEDVCGFGSDAESRWLRGSSIGTEHGRRAVTGETIKPHHLWFGPNGAVLPVFIDSEKRVGVGRGRRSASHVVQWLRASGRRLALLTNGRQWRLVFAGLDFDAFAEADAELFFEEGGPGLQLEALRTLLQPTLWTPAEPGALPPLERAILDARKGQAELSAVLGERVREAVELLVQAHGELLGEQAADIPPADVYRAAVRMIMRMVVVLFAESRELLPCDNVLYHDSYGLAGLIEELEKVAHRSDGRLTRSYAAWPRVLSLFRLVYQGSSHPALLVPAYGGELFAPGDPRSPEGLSRALALFERGCFERQIVSDHDVYAILELITRTKVRIRQGRATTWVASPVDFSDLSSEYIGILYEGLLDYELRQAPPGDPVVFLAVGNAPALPLSRLEAMDDRAVAALLEGMGKSARESAVLAVAEEGEAEDASDDAADSEDAADTAVDRAEEEEGAREDQEPEEAELGEPADDGDARFTTRTRAEVWARRAVQAGKLVPKVRGALTPEKRLAHEDAVARSARQLVSRVVLPGEWYVVRWGGTRKGAGTFYTRPGLAVPTVQRTLRPLAYDPPPGADGSPNTDATPTAWQPKRPEEILALKVVDPACGSGTFPVAALRFLTEALYESLTFHGRISDDPDGVRAIVRLIDWPEDEAVPEERLADELVPCRTTDPEFEPRLKARLRRHVVERCIYGVDLDPLAVELARLSLWIETMDRELPFSFLDHKVKCGDALVGAWFDTFRHYPVMAFKNREGGDKGHANGVHFAKEARTKALKEFAFGPLKSNLTRFLSGPTLFDPRDAATEAATAHDEALATLARLHELPVHDAAERAHLYRDELLGSPAYRQLRETMDLWCACWFWPADELDRAPLPTTLHDPPEETRAVARRIAAEKRFFHWELEFPDVFRQAGAGFDAVLGNPPWETLQPNSMEYFSNVDPLYRSYGKQEALRKQAEYFTDEPVERAWLDYNSGFACDSNWMKYAANPFGDPEAAEASGDRFSVARGKDNDALHSHWRDIRGGARGYADPAHPFRHRGGGKAYTYKLFLEQAHALLRRGGRLGFIVPSGLYSDHGAGDLRELFLDRCRWEWLFGFENRQKVFDIDSRFKFSPVVIEKGGRTAAIRTAFMRRALEDWERAEELTVPYSREQVERFSPKSRAILEIQSARDLEILEKIYANSVLLGDDSPDGWGVTYAQGDFNMTSDSKLFPPRPQWEAKGYRPDEYSRWLLGNWRPIEELWAELGVDFRYDPSGSGAPSGLASRPEAVVNPVAPPRCVVPAEIELEDWLFDATAGPERRMAEARFVHDHLLKPGDVARTSWRLRCAQPPYDALPIPRADIPGGIVLSREADAWIHEDEVEDVALPLYEGRMIGQFDFSQKGWVRGKGRSAIWREISWERKLIEPQFLMGKSTYMQRDTIRGREFKTAIMDVTSSTNSRTVIATVLDGVPCGHKTPTLTLERGVDDALALTAVLNCLAFDYQIRLKLGGNSLIWAVLAETAVPDLELAKRSLAPMTAGLALPAVKYAPAWTALHESACWRGCWLLGGGSRLRWRAALDAVCLALFGADAVTVGHVVGGCDRSGVEASMSDAKGFWRVDKDKDPELRHTVLTLVAFHDLEEKIRACGGDRDAGIEAFLGQNEGEGWMLPETLRLADYGLGHDERAKQPQPVASRLGPRFYDWQLAQSPEESWRECHLHARNLLGEVGYRELLDEIAARECGEELTRAGQPQDSLPGKDDQGALW